MKNSTSIPVSFNLHNRSKDGGSNASGNNPIPKVAFVPALLFGGKLFFLLFFVFLSGFKGIAQLPCLGVTTDCSSSSNFKCIQGPATISSLTGGIQPVLVPAAQSATTVQRIVIKGILTADITTASGGYTFAPGSEIIFADEFSGIEISGFCKLTLDNVTVKGCARMWRSVHAKTDATLVAKSGSTFSDGRDAIFAEHNSIISVTDCHFHNNLTSISLGTPLTVGQKKPVSYTSGGGIWGNDIVGGALKAPLNFSFSTRGISVFSVSTIQIGRPGMVQNDISNVNAYIVPGTDPTVAGLYTSNSDVTVTNSHFSNNGVNLFNNPNLLRYRDASISAENRSSVTLVGLGMGSEIIKDSPVGVYFNNSTGDISSAKFLNDQFDVVHEGLTAGSKLSGLKINNCKFEGFARYGVLLTSLSSLPVPLLGFEIKNSIFDENNAAPGNRICLNIQAGAQTNATNFVISDNKFYFRARPAGQTNYSATCLYIVNLNKGLAARNEFHDEGMVTLNRSFAGGTMDGCIGFTWDSNDFIGSGSGIGIDLLDPSAVYDFEFGMLISNSPMCKYTCNHLSSLQVGMQFFENCDGSTLRNNSFNSHLDHAIHLAEIEQATLLPVIGRQDRRSNTFSNGGRANFDYENYSPLNSQHVFDVQRSLFSIQTSNENSVLWANPREIDGQNDALDHIWFKFKPFLPTDPYPIYPCTLATYPSNNGNELDYWDMSLINNTFMPYKGRPADTWESSFYLYKRMNEDLNLASSASAPSYWYSDKYNGNLGKLSRVYSGLLSLATDTPISTASQLLSDLNALSLTTIYEQNLRTTLRIALEQYNSGGTVLTAQQLSDITAVADQCRGEGGLGVVFARLALGQPSVRKGDCLSAQERSDNAGSQSPTLGQAVKTTVFPNPVSDEFSVQVSQNIVDGQARLLDSKGQFVGAWKISGTQFTIQPGNVNSGVYLLELSDQGHVLSRNKLVVIR